MGTSSEKSYFGERHEARRKELKLSQVRYGNRLGVSQQQVSQWEGIAVPVPVTLRKMAQALELEDPDEIFDWVAETQKRKTAELRNERDSLIVEQHHFEEVVRDLVAKVDAMSAHCCRIDQWFGDLNSRLGRLEDQIRGLAPPG